MALDDQDIQKIQGLITKTFEGLPTVLDEQLNSKLKTWMKDEVIPMINGAKKSTLGDLEEKLGTIQETVAGLQKAQTENTPVDVEAAIAAGLEKILGDDQPDAKDKKQPKEGIDLEQLKKDMFAEFQTQFVDPLKQRVDQAEADKAKALEDFQAIEKRQAEQKRDTDFIGLLSKNDGIANDAAKLAFRAMVDEGLIQPSTDGTRYVVKERDKYDQEDIFTDATERLEQLVKHDSLKFFRPARQGTGTNSAPANNGTPANPTYKVIDPTSPPDANSMLETMKSNPDELLADLDKLATS